MSLDLVSVEQFRKKLESKLDMHLELIVNENRSTMLNLLEKSRRSARLSLHRMFLDAPEEVILAIAHYVRGTRTAMNEKTRKDLILRGYIQTNLKRFNYSKLIDKEKLVTAGNLYDLQAIYDELNETYFRSRLNLSITWFGEAKRKKRSRVIFGQYFDHLKLIKIHRLLDDPFYPDYFVKFVVYHEMLHDVVQGFVDSKGLYRAHGIRFKQREKVFEDYERAIAWEKTHKKWIFSHGRT